MGVKKGEERRLVWLWHATRTASANRHVSNALQGRRTRAALGREARVILCWTLPRKPYIMVLFFPCTVQRIVA